MPYTLSVPTTSIGNDPKPYTIYNLAISTQLRTSHLNKRYTDFVNLHSALTAAVGSPPPVALPSKSWFSRTVNNPELTEERKKGLDAYVRGIEEAGDAKWRTTSVWRHFLGFPSSNSSSGKDDEYKDNEVKSAPAMTANGWLDLHATLKTQLQEARTHLARREQATSTMQQHEAGAGAKKCLVKANTLVLRLEDGLRGLQEGKAGDRLGDGEVRRRRDLLSRARKEREGLDGVLNAWVIRNGSPVSNGVSNTAIDGQKDQLFAGLSSSYQAKSMPGAFPAPAKGRVLGGPAKETNRTRERDNEGVLQLQRQLMEEQDMDVEQLNVVVRRMKEMGIAINEELIEQGPLLDILDQDVDRYVLSILNFFMYHQELIFV
jgi:regulator of vacuolar morphogenesis